MKYSNNQMSIETIISSFNLGKISLIPPFQRGSVWKLADRQKLIMNILRDRPIPALFRYKEPEGAKTSYNILDGKQRLESLVLFIGDKRADVKIDKPRDYFFGKPAATDLNFTVTIDGKAMGFADLEEERVRLLREYQIATIEVDVASEDNPVSMDEIIDLFIDINQSGKQVNRFDMVKAMQHTPLFGQVLKLIAVKQNRNKKKSVYYKATGSDYVGVLKQLRIVSRVEDPNAKVDRMWERMTEVALFVRTGRHRSPADVLKGFIKAGTERHPNPEHALLSKEELARLKETFAALKYAYSRSAELKASKLATDQPQFYTLITTLLSTELVQEHTRSVLATKLQTVARALSKPSSAPARLGSIATEFNEVAARQTTHPKRRERRQELLVQAINVA